MPPRKAAQKAAAAMNRPSARTRAAAAVQKDEDDNSDDSDWNPLSGSEYEESTSTSDAPSSADVSVVKAVAESITQTPRKKPKKGTQDRGNPIAAYREQRLGSITTPPPLRISSDVREHVQQLQDDALGRAERHGDLDELARLERQKAERDRQAAKEAEDASLRLVQSLEYENQLIRKEYEADHRAALQLHEQLNSNKAPPSPVHTFAPVEDGDEEEVKTQLAEDEAALELQEKLQVLEWRGHLDRVHNAEVLRQVGGDMRRAVEVLDAEAPPFRVDWACLESFPCCHRVEFRSNPGKWVTMDARELAKLYKSGGMEVPRHLVDVIARWEASRASSAPSAPPVRLSSSVVSAPQSPPSPSSVSSSATIPYDVPSPLTLPDPAPVPVRSVPAAVPATRGMDIAWLLLAEVY